MASRGLFRPLPLRKRTLQPFPSPASPQKTKVGPVINFLPSFFFFLQPGFISFFLRPDNTIFGANLTELVAKTGVPCDRTSGVIPSFVRDIFQYLRADDRLKTKGLFRMSGNKSVITKIKEESDVIGTLVRIMTICVLLLLFLGLEIADELGNVVGP